MSSSNAHHLTVMTFNVRYDEDSDAHRWAARREAAIATVREHGPDLLAVQEATDEPWSDLAAALSQWSSFEAAGFFRTDRFDREASGVFPLTDDGARTCAWVRLRDREFDRELVFASTHFSTDADAWLPSAMALRAQLDTVAAGAPVIVGGDFNCAAGSDAHTYLQRAGYRDTWTEAGLTDAGVLTFHGFTPLTRLPEDPVQLDAWLNATSACDGFGHYPAHVHAFGNYRIDWILVRGALACSSASIDSRPRNPQPSDHYPVISTIRL
jgi:endonuclease/exonuclease/phosphatase family metal-dependent hydrolase